MDANIIEWLSQIGTNDWLLGFVKNNAYLIGGFLIMFGPMIKGKYPEFWENLKTIFPFVGQTKNNLIKQFLKEEKQQPIIKKMAEKNTIQVDKKAVDSKKTI